MRNPKIIRTSTVPMSLNLLLKGQLAYLSKDFEIIAVSSQGSDLDIVRERENIVVKAVDMERGISPLKDLISLIKMTFLLIREKPQIIHSITPKAGLISMLAGKIAGVPIRMHTFTGLIFPSKVGILQKILIAMDKLLCWSATNIYPEGQGVKNDLLKYDITSKPLKVLANGNVNGLDLNYFSQENFSNNDISHLKSSLGISENDFVYIFVGRLVGDKGIRELVAAFAEISKTNTKAKLILVGTEEPDLDPLDDFTKQTIDKLTNIIPVGFQSDIRPYLLLSNVFVFPSYREGFPNVVLQASAMELPCIVSDINGSNEIITDSVNGLVVPVKSMSHLKEAMIKLDYDRVLYDSLKLNTRSLMVSKFSNDLVWSAIQKEYRDLLGKN